MHHSRHIMHLAKCIRHHGWSPYIGYYKVIFKLDYDILDHHASCLLHDAWCIAHHTLFNMHHANSIMKKSSHRMNHTECIAQNEPLRGWDTAIFSTKIWPKVGNLEADPSHKKNYSDFGHNWPQVPPGFLVEAYIFKTEIKYFGCRAHPEALFLAPPIFCLVIFRSFFGVFDDFNPQNEKQWKK